MFNALDPGWCGSNFKSMIYWLNIETRSLDIRCKIEWTVPHQWEVNIDPGIGLQSGNKPLPEPMLTHTYVATTGLQCENSPDFVIQTSFAKFIRKNINICFWTWRCYSLSISSVMKYKGLTSLMSWWCKESTVIVITLFTYVSFTNMD